MQICGEDISQSVIIVGASPNILEQENGHIIDQFYEVVRVGAVVIEQYEQFVGTRTDCNITRNWKYELTPVHIKETIKKVVIIPDGSEKSLGLSAIEHCLENYSDRQLYITGFTPNLTSHLQRETEYIGKYYNRERAQWNLSHNMLKEDIYINKLICKSKIKIL